MVNFTFSIRKVLLGHDDHHSRYCRSLVHTVGSYLNFTTAIQAFGAGVNIGHLFTVGNHAVIGIRVDHDLRHMSYNRRKYSRKHVHTVCGGCEHPGIAV